MNTNKQLWNKNFILTTLSNLFLFFSFQMLIPTLPVYAEMLGGDELAAGLVIGMFTITALITRFFIGDALDQMNRRVILLIGLVIFSISVITYHWMFTIFMLLALRSIHGIGWGITTTTFGTIISDIIPSERRGEGMGYYGLSSTIAMAAAPFIGIWLMNEFGFFHLFLISFLLSLITIIFSQTIKITYDANNKSKERTGSFLERKVEKRALLPSVLVMFFSSTYGGIVAFINLYGKELGISNVGWFFMANAIMVMISRPIAGTLFDKKGHRWVLFPGVLFATVGIVLLSYTNSLNLLIISALFYGLGLGSIQPALQAWAINSVEANRRGAANATFFSAFDIGIGAGSILLGLISKYTGYAAMYRFSLIFLAFFSIVYLLNLNKNLVK